jgi:hypothetical protein
MSAARPRMESKGKDVRDLLNALRDNFTSRSLSRLYEADDGLGMWPGYLDYKELEDGIRGRDWTELTPEFLENHHEALCFFQAEAYAALLPAYLNALIENSDSLCHLPPFLLTSLTRREDERFLRRFDDRVNLLTDEQAVLVGQILRVLSSSPSHNEYKEEIDEALAGFWDNAHQALT